MKMKLFKANFTNSLALESNFLKGFRKWKLAFLMGFVMVLFAQPVYGDSPAPSTFGSSSTISVTNASTTTDFEGPLPIDMNPKNLIDGAFVNSTAGDILFTDQNSVEVGGIGTNISSNAVPFFWYTEVDKGTSKQLKLYTFNANPATHKFPLGGTTNDDITVADSASLDIADHLTLEATIELKEDPTGTQEIFFKQGEYRVYLDNGVLKADLDSTAMAEVWSTQNLVPDVSPTYNWSSPQNNINDGAVQHDDTTYCTAWSNVGGGWGANWMYMAQNTTNTIQYDFTKKWSIAFNDNLIWDNQGGVSGGFPDIPRKGPWADVINGIDVEGVYNHGSPTVAQDTGLGGPYYGQELIELVDDPEGHTTQDNFKDWSLIWWSRDQSGTYQPSAVSEPDWQGIGNWAWGADGQLGDDVLHNMWNDSDQQSQAWYDLHYPPSQISANQGIQANNNTQFTDGGSYGNALIHSSLWAGWEQNLAGDPYTTNPLYDLNQKESYSDTLFFNTTNHIHPMHSWGGSGFVTKVPWFDRDRGYMTTNNAGGWYGCKFGYRFTDFDETDLQNIKILGIKTHLIFYTNSNVSNQGQDYIDIRYMPDSEVQPHMFNNAGYTLYPWPNTGFGHWLYSGALSQSFVGDIYHWGEPMYYNGANTYVSFTHPTTDVAHPKYGQTMTVPDNYGWRDCYGGVSTYSPCFWHTVEDVNHIAQAILWGQGGSSKVEPTAHWIEVRYFAEKLQQSQANLVSTANPLVKDQNYDIKLTFDKPDVKLYVDGVEVASGTLNGDLTNSVNDVVIGESIAGWVDDVKIGTTDISNPTYALQLAFEPSHNTNTQIGDISNSWTYAGTIADQSGNANNATYNLVADTTDITTTVGGLQVTDDVPAGTGTETVANMVGAVPIATFLTPTPSFLESQIASGAVSALCEIDPTTGLQVDPNCVQGEHSPFLAGLFLADENSGMPQGVWWLLLATLVATILGSKMFKFIPSLTIVAIVGGVVLGFITLIAGLSYWFLLFYTLWAMGSISIHQYWKA